MFFQDSLSERQDGTAGKGKSDLILTSMPSAEREGNPAALAASADSAPADQMAHVQSIAGSRGG